jgi:hypothetical protein
MGSPPHMLSPDGGRGSKRQANRDAEADHRLHVDEEAGGEAGQRPDVPPAERLVGNAGRWRW